MKKVIVTIALTSFSTLAFAQSSVQLYGKMRVYQESYKAGTGTPVTQQSNDGSRIGFRGNEDLGAGLKANFVVETNVFADSPNTSTIGDRQSTVGLSSNFGSIDLGRAKNAITLTYDKYDVFGNGAFTSMNAVHNNQGFRFNNGSYFSINPGAGVSINYQHSVSEVVGSSYTNSGSVNFDGKMLSLTHARYSNHVSNESNVTAAALKLNDGKTYVSAIYSDDKALGLATTGKSIMLNQNLKGPLNLLATYGENENLKFTAVGFNYSLSKRTTLVTRYMNQDHVVNSKDFRRIAVGIDHNF